MSTIIEKQLISTREVAKLLGVGHNEIKKLRERYGLPYIEYGQAYRYPLEAVRDWIRASTKTNARTA